MSRRELDRPDPVELLQRLAAETRPKALFRTYLGYANGCGTTTAMLDEARRRASRGTDVVVAAYTIHGGPGALDGLDVLGGARSKPDLRALDLDAVLARNPQVVCIDDLASLGVDGSPRFEAVPRLLGAGITVLATLHLLSISSAAETFAGVLGEAGDEGRLVDDRFVANIHELELVDLPPAELLERLRTHPVLSPARLALAMQRELRPEVLGSLRELAFRVIADHTDRDLLGYLQERRMPTQWEVRGRIVLCLPVRRGLEERIIGAGRYAAAQDAQLTVVSVRTRSQSPAEKEMMGGYAATAHRAGGEFVHLHGRSVADALVSFIAASRATEVILGHRRGRWRPWDTTSDVIRRLAGVDVHILRSPASISKAGF